MRLGNVFRMKIYLCGTMKAGGLRNSIIERLTGHDVLDPSGHHLETETEYTAWDLAAIRECDAVVAFMDPSNPSGYGLNLEIGYAHALGKRIIYIDAMGNDWRSKYFGMARAISEVVTEPAPIASMLEDKCGGRK